MFACGAQLPLRHSHVLQAGRVGTVTSLLMPAWTSPGQGAAYYGVKIVNIAPGNAALSLPGLHASHLLHDAATGVPLALIDGDQITARRRRCAGPPGRPVLRPAPGPPPCGRAHGVQVGGHGAGGPGCGSAGLAGPRGLRPGRSDRPRVAVGKAALG